MEWMITFTIIGLSAALIGITGSIISGTRSRLGRISSERQLSSSEYRINTLAEQLQQLQDTFQKIEVPEKEKLELSSLATRMDKLDSDFKDLRSLLFNNPEATITIPLLKKDFESLAQDNKNIRKEIDHTRGLTKWFIGIMATTSIGLLSLAIAISIFLKGG